MQRLAWKIGCRCKRGGFRLGLAPRRGAIAAILGIADQGMAQMGHMHPNLVGAPGFQPAFHQRGKGAFHGAEFLQRVDDLGIF